MANEAAQIRVGIDWSNKGTVCMGAKPTDLSNLVPNSIYYETHVTTPAGVTKDQLGYSQISPCGAVRWLWSTSLTIPFGLFIDHPTPGSDTSRTLAVSSNTTYTFIIWFQPTSPTIPDDWTFDVYTGAGAGGASTLKTSVSGATATQVDYNNYRLKIQFTSGASDVRAWFYITKPSGLMSMTVFGAALVQGTSTQAPDYYNCNAVDPLSKRDDITDYIMQVNHQLGKTSWDQAMPNEGTAEIIVKNDTRIFSPEYESSPIYGNIKPRRRVWIERRSSSTVNRYFTVWTGWTKQYDVTPGEFGPRDATISCEQGLYNLEKTLVNPYIRLNQPTGTALFYALENGFEFPSGSAYAMVGRARVNSSWVVNPAVLINNYTAGQTLPEIGLYWENQQSAIEIIEDIVDIENNWLFMNRHGSLNFQTAAQVAALSSPITPPTNILTDISYKFGDEIFTGLQLELVLQTLTPVAPENRFALSDTVTVDVDADTQTIVFTPLTYNNDFSVDEKSYGLHGDQIATAVRLDDPSTTVTIGGVGSSVVLGFVGGLKDSRSDDYLYSVAYSVRNTNSFPVKVSIQTLGYGWKLDFDGSISLSDNTQALDFGFLEKKISNPNLKNFTLYDTYKTNKLKRYATVYGWFDSVSIYATDDSTSYISQLTVGSLWRFTDEYQTDISNKDMIVIGEIGEWTPHLYKYTIISSPRF